MWLRPCLVLRVPLESSRMPARCASGRGRCPQKSTSPWAGLVQLGLNFDFRPPQPGLTFLGEGAAPGAAAGRLCPTPDAYGIRAVPLHSLRSLRACRLAPAAAPLAACRRLASFAIHFRQTLRPAGHKTRGCAATRVLLTGSFGLRLARYALVLGPFPVRCCAPG